MPYRLGAARDPATNSEDGDGRYNWFLELGLNDDFLPIHIDYNSRTDVSTERHGTVKKIRFDHVEERFDFIYNDWPVWEIPRLVGVSCMSILWLENPGEIIAGDGERSFELPCHVGDSTLRFIWR